MIWEYCLDILNHGQCDGNNTLDATTYNLYNVQCTLIHEQCTGSLAPQFSKSQYDDQREDILNIKDLLSIKRTHSPSIMRLVLFGLKHRGLNHPSGAFDLPRTALTSLQFFY